MAAVNDCQWCARLLIATITLHHLSGFPSRPFICWLSGWEKFLGDYWGAHFVHKQKASSLSGWRSAWFPAWGHSVGERARGRDVIQGWIGDYAGFLGWREDELGWRVFVCVYMSQPGLVSIVLGKLIWTCQVSSYS